MNWLNLNIQTLDSENFLGSDPIDRATWLCLLRYCIGQENGGMIQECSDWADRKWQQLVRITKKEASRECDLWSWEGKTLIVWGYPAEKEDEVQQKRDRAKTNGAKGGRPKKTNEETQEKPTLVISAKAEGERNGRELEREERERAPATFDEFADEPAPEQNLSQHAQEIVSAYPRREKIADALKIVLANLRDGEDPKTILTGTKACAAVIRSMPGGSTNRYVPGAEAFFAKKRWQDDPECMRRQPEDKTAKSKTSNAASYGI